VFDSRVLFSGTADRVDLVPVALNPRWRPAAIFEISDDDISGMGRPINFVLNASVGFTGKYVLLVINLKPK